MGRVNYHPTVGGATDRCALIATPSPSRLVRSKRAPAAPGPCIALVSRDTPWPDTVVGERIPMTDDKISRRSDTDLEPHEYPCAPIELGRCS